MEPMLIGQRVPELTERSDLSTPELLWLPPAPDDWSVRLRGIGEQSDGTAWKSLVALASYRLDSLATIRLDRRAQALFNNAPPPKLETKPVRLAILASSTVDHLLPALRVAALRRNIWLHIHTGDYGQYSRELTDPGSDLHAYRPDAVLFALDAHHLLAGFDAGMPDTEARFEQVQNSLVDHWRLARQAFNCPVVQQTVLPVFPLLFGNNEHRLSGTQAGLVERLNAKLRELAEQEAVDLLAIDRRAAQDGIGAWYDQMLWHRAKQEVHPSAAGMYGELFGRLLAARQGRSFKCLVLDLDNTLWGGVIGDDGMEGIKLGQGSAIGEAFVAFQSYARSLSRRGIILAVCSKNDEANALEPFEKHPDMVLRRNDIACFVANWTDKASNLREIAGRLNIGLDSLVFADDNPFERNIVRRELPMVAVPELPDDAGLYAQTIADAGYFEAVALTQEDLERGAQYQANLARETLKSSVTDVEGYLRSLNMEMRWSRFDRVGLQRIVQLINKTNQFNLTTRRTDDEKVLGLIGDNRALTLQLRLLDQFGDNGIIAIIAGQFTGGTADMKIDTWLMSCRVLGRQVEETTLNLVASQAQELGAERLIGEYRPTAKNGMVREHYKKLGFDLMEQTDDNATLWSLPLSDFRPFPTFIRTVEA
jgi:FkbH-like protein